MVVMSVALILLILECIRRGRLKEEYSLLWLFTSLGVLLVGLRPSLVAVISDLMGMYYISAILFIAFIFLILIIFYLTLVISRLSDRNRDLTQRFSLLQKRVSDVEDRLGVEYPQGG